eukprot:2736392-Amphidinium_carterae.1
MRTSSLNNVLVLSSCPTEKDAWATSHERPKDVEKGFEPGWPRKPSERLRQQNEQLQVAFKQLQQQQQAQVDVEAALAALPQACQGAVQAGQDRRKKDTDTSREFRGVPRHPKCALLRQLDICRMRAFTWRWLMRFKANLVQETQKFGTSSCKAPKTHAQQCHSH